MAREGVRGFAEDMILLLVTQQSPLFIQHDTRGLLQTLKIQQKYCQAFSKWTKQLQPTL